MHFFFGGRRGGGDFLAHDRHQVDRDGGTVSELDNGGRGGRLLVGERLGPGAL